MARTAKKHKQGKPTGGGSPWASAVRKAFAGEKLWLHRVILETGYLGDFRRLTATQVGMIFGVTAQAVGLWHSKMTCPRNQDRTYAFMDVLAWRIQDEAKRLKSTGFEAPLEQQKIENLKLQRKIRMEELRERRLRNDLQEGKLVSAADVIAWANEVAATMKAELDAIGKAHGPEVARDIHEAVERFVSAREERFGEESDG